MLLSVYSAAGFFQRAEAAPFAAGVPGCPFVSKRAAAALGGREEHGESKVLDVQ